MTAIVLRLKAGSFWSIQMCSPGEQLFQPAQDNPGLFPCPKPSVNSPARPSAGILATHWFFRPNPGIFPSHM